MKIITIMVIAIVLLVVPFVGMFLLENPTGQAVIKSERVEISNVAFAPQVLKIGIGTTVVWVNEDTSPHIVKTNGLFQSETLSPGEDFAYTFSSPGTYEYECAIYPTLTGKIIVE